MRCPFCSHEDSQVKDSRHTEDNTAIRRRRICDQCGSRFTTFERIQLRDLIVIKSNGQKETFDRDKMFRSLSLALRKRKVEQDKIEKIVSAIARRLENSGETEIKTSIIGEYIMEALSNLDQVAYVRFASVYKNFREVKDFEDFLDNLEEK
ncbi:MAG: transcriptional repressor NrdR [Pelagibacteraceae bacterium]|jgi:transcriptional repressor NrdR|nr:transcriptional repressor NrdR [Pelagibacteraceae bacterium]HJO14121.1 transcriptional regulator NrdR [Alphaproteobacteria bacterium]MBO6468240.1 transcriptional repressor NrdR [Pelagibacteraceae bacterium]MBO6469321.1 transcriptional repressor NrdR [Pelagibacteraceae bacterium]MBO6469518.1 transcriptional repressor NrdR [Pelagibacteraceae bacterium]|tara:strand:+ start:435 stop:887 length:453 start_codon:yes stop_codon:yes gene_type:complete